MDENWVNKPVFRIPVCFPMVKSALERRRLCGLHGTGTNIALANNTIDTTEKPLSNRLWVLWVLFFFQFAAIGIYFTYLNIFYREAGLSGTEIGITNMGSSLIGMAGVVIWGYFSDRTGKSRLLIAIGAAGALIVAQIVPFVHSFPAFFALGVIGSLLNSSTSTLVDSTTLVLLGDRREEYGRYRLGGTIGYILTTGTAGFLFDRAGLRLMFPAYGIIMAAFALAALLLPALPVRREAHSQGAIGMMVRQPAWLLFTTVVFLCWIASNASIMFLGVSLNAMGANQALIGLAVTIGAVVEMPFMGFSGRLLRRFGATRLLIFAITLMVIRFFLLGWMPVPEWAVAINMLNGIAFPLFWTSSVTYANKLAPPGLSGTAIGLFNSASSLAAVVSSLLTGWLFDSLGPNGLFVVMAFCVLAALILFIVGTLWQQRTRVEAAENTAG
jgi:MFS transporter, PPP family, 3-phenylpropionic acid transporter